MIDGGPPRVALIVLNWNGLADTDRCLRSLASVTYPRLDVIVVDNGSHDGTSKFVRAQHPDVTLIELDSNEGYAGGNNVGLRAACDRGFDIIGVLNNDTVVEPDFLNPVVAELMARPESYISPRIMYLDQPTHAWFGAARIDDRIGIMYHRDEGTLTADELRAEVRDELAVTGCCLIAQRSAWERVGLFDERYFLIFEDYDWCARANQCGLQGRIVRSSTIHHAVSSSFARSSSPVGAYYYTRNGLLYLRSHRRGIGWPVRFLANLFRESTAKAVRHPSRWTILTVKWQAAGVLDFARGRFGRRRISAGH